MTEELTDANLVARLRLPYSADPPLAKIAADRLEELAGVNATLRDQRDQATADVAALTAERDRLREAVRKYGCHWDSCPNELDVSCTCGFDAVSDSIEDDYVSPIRES